MGKKIIMRIIRDVFKYLEGYLMNEELCKSLKPQ